MNTLTLELLSSVLSNIEDKSIEQLSITSKNMGNITNKLKDNAIFYKSRVENILGYYIDSSYKGDWKGFYYILIEDGLNNALCEATITENNLAIKVLLADGRADPSENNTDIIQWASAGGHTDIVKLLLSDPRVDPSAKNNAAIKESSEYDHKDIVKLLLADPRVDPSAEDNYAIRLASSHGHTEIVKLLLTDSRVDPSDTERSIDDSDVENNEAIIDASFNGHTEVVKLLLADPRVDPSANNNKAIQLASNYGYKDIVKLLLADPRVDPSAEENEAIKLASKKGRIEVVKLLLGSNKINLQVKTRMLTYYDLPGLNYKSFINLSKEPLEELISLGNRSQNAKDIIMTKYFWWLRLKILYNMDNIKGDPFEVALQQEQ